MKITKKLLPGQPGTKKLVKKFGNDLFCVRYRYDSGKKRKIKTAEIILEESYWERDSKKIQPNEIVFIQVKYGEVELGKRIRAAGGRWDRRKKLWEICYKQVEELKIQDRIVFLEQ